ncbi:P-loop containing nucleoside triphosphate hydrolase [Ostreococcus tauri]|uniref:Kinesin-like protein n=1 Tax=Ostreococcus tauri TaxID=70448 RepID=A0A090M4D7_OSTTA|nr:P-loop containing nucleoside triphosphate hydrolase [Ostreococcus tauri]CEF99061.1 P-loop containing nucleoside triphosphate hydrolase [Ostreococcus tauri]|eukprot:XP_003081216.2 P-loop containing nucleoside triphosphate hydrolase [Ostreococcus tauri]
MREVEDAHDGSSSARDDTAAASDAGATTANERARVRVVVRVRREAHGDGRAVRAEVGGVRVLERSSRTRTGGREESFVAFRGACAGSGTTQRAFFDVSGTKALLEKTLDGYSSAVFAYGQTGSGKTYTMLGGRDRATREDVEENDDEEDEESDEGVIARSLRFLFDACEKRNASDDRAMTVVTLTYYEIYKEKIIDLLTNEESSCALRVRWRKQEGFHVPNLTSHECASAEEALDLVHLGAARRQVRAHNLNASSSRSHAVLTVHVDRHFNVGGDDDGAAGNDSVRCVRGKMTFVDLAGSERLKLSGSEDIATRETSLINKSLFALGKVIATLAEESRDARTASAHVPYRDSKLTKLLMDSLGGRSMSLMIACVTASERHVEETIRTLQYAARVTSIVNAPELHHEYTSSSDVEPEFGRDRELEELRRANQALRRRVSELLSNARVDDHCHPRTASPRAHDVQQCVTNHTSDVVHRVERVETLLRKYAEENRRLERENRALRARREIADIERVHALDDAERLRIRVDDLQRAFFTV